MQSMVEGAQDNPQTLPARDAPLPRFAALYGGG
jgi:hypothetical protein